MISKLVNLLKDIVAKRSMETTLNIQKPNGTVIYLVAFILIGYVLIGEFVFSHSTVQQHLMGPKIGSRHRQFEVQWARLEKLVKEGKQIDCIFLGNSMVWIDIDPLIVSKTVKDRTGQAVHCFNFGVSALPASSAGLIAPVLIERYHPQYLIYGTFARDYTIPATAEDATAITATPWLQYQTGKFNMIGWLYDHSSFYQYKNYVADFLLLDFGDVFPGYNGFPAYHDYGFDPKIDVRIDVQKSPDLKEIGSEDAHRWLYRYQIRGEDLQGLRQILRQSERGTKVIVIEMPFYPTAFQFFLNGEKDYDEYVEQVEQIAASKGIEFWRLDQQPEVPKEDWWDYFHMNIRGAKLYSEWLGNELGRVVLEGAQRPASLAK